MNCIRCQKKPAVKEFICEDCLYNDYDHAFEMWGEWQDLARETLTALDHGLVDASEIIALRRRFERLENLRPLYRNAQDTRP